MLDGLKGQLPKNGARQVGQDVAKTIISEREQPGDPMPEWLDLKALPGYACVSERTLCEWIHRDSNPLPAARVGTKLLIQRSSFDRWLEAHQVKQVDVGCMVDEILAG